MASPMVEVLRGGYLESMHMGDAAFVSSKANVLAKAGDAGFATFWRSAAKPVQALLPVISGAVDRYGITEKELAVICASHYGESMHIEAVASILSKAAVPEDALSCGIHMPFSRSAAQELIRGGEKARPIHHNCSGKHAGMLITCKAMGWDPQGYFLPEHPLQKATLSMISEISGVPEGEIGIGVDGCSVAVFYLPVRAMAYSYARLAAPDSLPSKYRDAASRATGAMMSYPDMVSGNGTFTTELMKAYRGRIFAKNGAEGVFSLGLHGRGIGMTVKVQDGNDRAFQTAVVGLLDAFGVRPDPGSALPAEKPIKNAKGDVVGSMRPAFALETTDGGSR